MFLAFNLVGEIDFIKMPKCVLLVLGEWGKAYISGLSSHLNLMLVPYK